METEILKPRALQMGDSIGVFTPSSPAYIHCPGLFENGVRNLEKLGFKVKLGDVTKQRKSQGYRSAPPKERADEMMTLICDPEVKGLISTIGGSNSASLIPFLDFDLIRANRKIVCGFSDVTALHAAILKFSRLKTIYGPSVMCWFGDWKNTERAWKANEGWKVLNPGSAKAEILAFNLNTLLSCAGTPYWPDFKNKILLIEDMDAPQSRNERLLRQLSAIGAFDEIAGLIIGKPEFYDQQDAPFTYDDLIIDIVGPRPYPMLSNFDCGHTVPMISIPQLAPVLLETTNGKVRFDFLDGSLAV